MTNTSRSRILVTTFILFVFAAFAVGVNWRGAAATALPLKAAEMTPVSVSIPNVTAAQGSIATVPIVVGDVTGLGVVSFDTHIAYDPAILQPATPPVDRTGTLSSGMAVNPVMHGPGHLVISAFLNGPIAGSGTLINLRFNVVGTTGQSTTIMFETFTDTGGGIHPAFMFNEGIPSSFTTDGSLTIGGATPTASPTPTATNQATPTASPALPIPVVLPNVNAAQGSIISVPINIGDVTGYGVSAFETQVTFDPAVVQPASPAFDLTGTLGERMFPFPNVSHPGHLIIPAFQPAPAVAGAGALIYLRFSVVGAPGQSTSLTLEDWTNPANHLFNGFMFNEGYPGRSTTSGSVTVTEAAVSGTVTYGNTTGNLTPRSVSNVIISGAGSLAGCLTSTGFPGGDYLLSGFTTGSYTVTPSKTGGVNGAISSFDAARISQHVAGIVLLAGNPLTVADVSRNGVVTSFDAAQIARYVAGIPGSGSTGSWRFGPASRTYASVASAIAGENYSALLMGEVSGDWSNSSSRPATGSTRAVNVGLPRTVMSAGQDVLVPVNVRGIGKKGVISYEFDLRYDPSLIQPNADAVDLTSTVSGNLSVVTNVIEPGLLRVVAYGPMPINSDGVLLNLRFAAVGKTGESSPLSFERFMFNEGEPRVNATRGQVELF